MEFTTMKQAFSVIGTTFDLAPFHTILGPMIQEVLDEKGLNKFRKGSILIPRVLIWLVLSMTLRRDLSADNVFSWMMSGFRWIKAILPAKAKIVTDGAISKARACLGIEPFECLLEKQMAAFDNLPRDFHGLVSYIFDGTTGSMPDTDENRAYFHKPSSQKGQAGFPLVRIMALLAFPVRLVVKVAYAPYSGKGTGERTLVMQILESTVLQDALFLLDAGLYSFKLIYTILQKDGHFLIKVPSNFTVKIIKKLADGSYIAIVSGKIIDPDAQPRSDGKNSWKKVEITVRLIRYQIPGFKTVTLISSLLDENITAKELILHYHKRWDIEITYDEIKTHQCATLRGQIPTLFRSKRPDLVKQELLAMMIMYNATRELIWKAAVKHNKDPLKISFLAALQHIIDAIPMLTAQSDSERKWDYLLELIADGEIDRPRRARVNPRVVKIKSKKWPRKNSKHKSIERHLEKEITIVPHNLSNLSDNPQPSESTQNSQTSPPPSNSLLVNKNKNKSIDEMIPV